MKMRKNSSRKRGALWALAGAAALLVLVLYFTDYGLLPAQGVGQVERRLGTGPTWIAKRLGKPPVAAAPVARLYLSAGEDVVLFTRSQWDLASGWTGWGQAVDCSGEGALHAGCELVRDDYTGEYVIYLFGRVEDGRAVSLEAETGVSGDPGTWMAGEKRVFGPEVWAGDGLFCLELDRRSEPDWIDRVWARVRLLDAEGAALAHTRVSGEKVSIAEPFA